MPAGSDAPAQDRPVLAVDVGGTKIAAGVVTGAHVSDKVRLATPQRPTLGDLVDAVRDAVARVPDVPGPVAVATAGAVRDGALRALNDTFDVPDWQPFAAPLSRALDRPVVLLNDAQAATWGEFRHGAGVGTSSMVFLTVSTGIGGGIVAGGRLLVGRQGLAGSVGQIRLDPGDPESPTLESRASGSGLAQRATALFGRPVTAERVLSGDDGAVRSLVSDLHRLVAGVVANLTATIDPELVVVGGGVGLSPGTLDGIRGALLEFPPLYRPAVKAAVLGHDAGLVGCADWLSSLPSRAQG